MLSVPSLSSIVSPAHMQVRYQYWTAIAPRDRLPYDESKPGLLRKITESIAPKPAGIRNPLGLFWAASFSR